MNFLTDIKIYNLDDLMIAIKSSIALSILCFTCRFTAFKQPVAGLFASKFLS